MANSYDRAFFDRAIAWKVANNANQEQVEKEFKMGKGSFQYLVKRFRNGANPVRLRRGPRGPWKHKALKSKEYIDLPTATVTTNLATSTAVVVIKCNINDLSSVLGQL